MIFSSAERRDIEIEMDIEKRIIYVKFYKSNNSNPLIRILKYTEPEIL